MPRHQGTITGLLLTLLGSSLLAQTDDFNDGNTDGWTRSDVLAALGGTPSEFNFPDGNRIELKSFASPDAETLGPSRVGLFREDVLYTDVTVLIDVVSWDNDLFQDVGMLARGTTIGLGTTSGYALSYDVDEQAVYLSRLDNEAAATLSKFEFPLDPAISYRFRLNVIGNLVTASVADAAVPELELVVLEAEDDTYANGSSGLFTNAGVADGTTKATFDNFASFDPTIPATPPSLESFTRSPDSVQLGYSVPIQTSGDFLFEASDDLLKWNVLEKAKIAVGSSGIDFEASDQTAPAQFYRLREAPPLFTDGFENGAEDWTIVLTAGDTQWELGTPAAPDLSEAHGGTNAYGTNLATSFTNGSNTALRSPIIDLSEKVKPKLSFWYYVDVTEGNEGTQVNYLSETGEVIELGEDIFWTKTDTWTFHEAVIPETVRGRKIMVEWLFRSDGNDPNGAGFFLDDVTVD